jgi:subtilisin family serine protease
MSPRGRAGLTFGALLAAALGVSACIPIKGPPPPPPPPPPAGPQCHEVATLSFESDSPAAVTYDAVVDTGGGESEYVSFEAAGDAEVVEQVAEIEATVGPVTEIEQQAAVGILDVTPTDDPRYGAAPSLGPQQAALDQAMFNVAWANHEDGAGVIVAVVDTGVQSHADLAANLLPGADFVGDPGSACGDPHGHGTHVAGILGQVDNTIGGVGGAPSVDILPVRVLDGNGEGNSADVAAGIDWAVANYADVINLSLGAGSPAVIDDAVGDAIDAGVTVVAAAGNCGNPFALPASCGGVVNDMTYPAALPGVIAVGALQTGQNARASFSNDNDYVAIAAPGTNIDSTLPNAPPHDYGTKSGTSMATPFVSAVAALMLRDCPAMLPLQVLGAIQSSATQFVTGFADDEEELVDAGAAAAASCT